MKTVRFTVIISRKMCNGSAHFENAVIYFDYSVH